MIPASPQIDFDHRRPRTTSPVRPEVEERCYLAGSKACATDHSRRHHLSSISQKRATVPGSADQKIKSRTNERQEPDSQDPDQPAPARQSIIENRVDKHDKPEGRSQKAKKAKPHRQQGETQANQSQSEKDRNKR